MEIVKDWSYFMSNFSLQGAQTLCGQLLVAAPMVNRVRLFAHRAAKTRRNSVITAAAHLDEDWNMEQWGRDAHALQRRAYRYAELQAATKVLQTV